MHVSARGSQSRTRVNRATREASRPIPSNDRTSHDINNDRAFGIARHPTLASIMLGTRIMSSSMPGPPITDEPLTLVRLLTLTLPKQVMLARFTLSGNVSWRPPFLDSGITACTVCRSGTIRASNASRLFISSSIDGSKAIDPTLTSDQSLGAATVPIHPDLVTRCEPREPIMLSGPGGRSRPNGRSVIVRLNLSGSENTRALARADVCGSARNRTTSARTRFDTSASRMRSDKFPSSNGDIYPTITRKI